jgi:ketosteroid isomerase-like protein
MRFMMTLFAAAVIGSSTSAYAAVDARPPSSPATTKAAVTDPNPMNAINQLRTELVESFNKGDVDRLLSHLDPDVVATWQNGEVCRGPAAVRAYYDKMMSGPDRIVAKLTAAPAVDDRHVYGDWAVSWGNLHDDYLLTDGRSFKFDSRFTATIARRGEAWKVTSFHASVNAFDNPILGVAAKKAGSWGGIIGVVVGVVIGAIVGVRMGKRKRATGTAA